MHILCWNLKTNSANTIPPATAQQIAKELHGFKQGPFVLFVLENKGDPATVAGDIAHALGSGIVFGHLHVGGSVYRRESVLWVCPSNVSLNTGRFTGWRSQFEGALENDIQRVINTQIQQGQDARNRYSLRNPTADLNIKGVQPEDFRDPLLVEISYGRSRLKVGVVHAPGPGDSAEHMATKFAALYFKAIMNSLATEGVDVVVGDFNLYESTDAQGFKDVSTDSGPTTYGQGRLDRAFVRTGLPGKGFTFGPATEPNYTDHRPIGLAGAQPMGNLSSAQHGLVCTTCGKRHGGWISVINLWHYCPDCGARYCDTCGSARARPNGASWGRARACACGGVTTLVR